VYCSVVYRYIYVCEFVYACALLRNKLLLSVRGCECDVVCGCNYVCNSLYAFSVLRKELLQSV
jgi:hypothetical protein